MAEQQHCSECQGTGKTKLTGTRSLVACLHCAGTGIEPVTPKPAGRKIIGPLHTYPGMKRDAMIIVCLIVLMLVIRMIS